MEKKVYEIRSGSAMLTEKEFKKFQKGDTINGTYKSSVVMSYDNIEEAKQMLKRLKCTCKRNNVNGLYYISEYGFIDEDDCGTCDIYLAEDEKVEILYTEKFNKNDGERKTKADYINSIKIGDIIIFNFAEGKATSAKATEIYRDTDGNVKTVICQSRKGTFFKVPVSKIAWVKKGSR